MAVQPVVVGEAAFSDAAAAAAHLQEQTHSLQQLQASISALSSRHASLTDSTAAYKAEISELEGQLAALAAQRGALESAGMTSAKQASMAAQKYTTAVQQMEATFGMRV